jgi:thiamine biosynthesis lipoprotein
VLSLFAVAAGLPMLPALAGSTSGDGLPRHRWQGRALGAQASLVLAHPDPKAAAEAASLSIAEVRRLERIFSLYDADSEISRLNRAGFLGTPSHDLRRLLAEALRLGRLTDGAFDISVQPLWRLYADHFARNPGDRIGPDPRRIAESKSLVDYRKVILDDRGISLGRRGMALTLNGIAQGYITDRVAALLRQLGFNRVLVQLGEIAALDPPADGEGWRIGLQDPRTPEKNLAVLELANRAVATSSGSGTPFDRDGRYHHLFDPASGQSATRYLATTVVADRASVADALSTALSILPLDAAEALLRTTGIHRAVDPSPRRCRGAAAHNGQCPGALRDAGWRAALDQPSIRCSRESLVLK